MSGIENSMETPLVFTTRGKAADGTLSFVCGVYHRALPDREQPDFCDTSEAFYSALEKMANEIIDTHRGMRDKRALFFAEFLLRWIKSAKANGVSPSKPFPEAYEDGYALFLQPPKKENGEWENVYWGFPDTIIAEVLGLSRQSVNAARKRFTKKNGPEKIAVSHDSEERILIMKELNLSVSMMDAVSRISRKRIDTAFAMLPSALTIKAEDDLEKTVRNHPLGMIRFVSETRKMTDLEATRAILALVPKIRDDADADIEKDLGIPPGSLSDFLDFWKRFRNLNGYGGYLQKNLAQLYLSLSGSDSLAPDCNSIQNPVVFISKAFSMDEKDALRILWAFYGHDVRSYVWSRIVDKAGDETLRSPLWVATSVGFRAEYRILSRDAKNVDIDLSRLPLSRGRISTGLLRSLLTPRVSKRTCKTVIMNEIYKYRIAKKDLSGNVSDEELKKFFDDISPKFPIAIDLLVKNGVIVKGPAYLGEQIPDFDEKLAELFV